MITHQKVRAILKKGGFDTGRWGKTGRAGCVGTSGDIQIRSKWGCVKDEVEVSYFNERGRLEHEKILKYLKKKLKNQKVTASDKGTIYIK